MLATLWRCSRPLYPIARDRTRSQLVQRSVLNGAPYNTTLKPGARQYASIAPAATMTEPSSPMPALNGNANHATSTYRNFDLVRKFKLDFTDVEVSKWRSRVTGLSVVHLDYDAPLVNGYFVVATEIFNDTGCPHTLEHLVFMGSQKYPYKGIIDHLANRGFSNGTNAWTDTDHTAYTVSTAGEQGFLQLLPIYVDHILYPTMTKAGFVTEVHHIDPKGADSGVVYSEMQGRENTSGDLMELRKSRLMNPAGSAYRSETGGLMEALRVLTVEQIRDYHSTYYVPHNLTLIVCGKLASGTESLLKVVQEQIEPSLVEHGQNKGPKPEGWKRPFMETASVERKPLTEDKVETVTFPEKDESVSELVMSFMGPSPMAFLERKALDVLGTYLTSSATAPLNKEYIEIESPLCTYIYFGEDTRATSVDLPVYVGSIPTAELDGFDARLRGSLKRIADEGVDMERMRMIIARDERQLRSKLESAKGDTFSGSVIDDILYGETDGSKLPASMDEINGYAELRTWKSAQWSDLLRRYYAEPPAVIIKGKPSATMADRLEKDEKARLEAQVEKLGPEGIEKAAKILEEAKAEHDHPIPQDILTAFPVPDVKSISWIPVSSVQQPGKGRASGPAPLGDVSTQLQQKLDNDGDEVPFFIEYDHVKSDFVTVHMLSSLANLPDELRPYISTYLTAFFALPVKLSSGKELNHEEVINQLDDQTVSYDVSLGFNGLFTELLRVSIKVETSQYGAAVAWLHDLLYGSRFDRERLAVAVAKIQQNLPELKRDGSSVLSAVAAEQLYASNSTSKAGALLDQLEFIPKLSKQLQETPDEVIAKFEEIRKYITDSAGIRFSVQGNVLDVAEPRGVWRKNFGEKIQPTKLAPVPIASSTLNAVGKAPSKKAVVVSLPTIESSFVTYTAKGIHGFQHPEYAAVRIASEVLNATESYLWRYIRGSGLAYGAYVSVDTESGLLSFSLYRSSNSLEGYRQGALVLKGLVDGSIAFDATTLDAAKSSVVFGVAKGVSTAGRAASMAFSNQALKGVPRDWNVQVLESLQAVTKADVLAVLEKYFLPLFNSATSVATVVTAPGKADEIAKGLTAEGFEVEKRTLQVDPEEMEDGEESGSDDESGSEMDTESDDGPGRR